MEKKNKQKRDTPKSDAKAVRIRRIQKGNSKTSELRKKKNESLFGERDVK
ncbi:MAG TPA: hypothetical protein VHO50_05220 [Bacteroidales bacterium]|nr:hypothetical protein [Bacteroidales bacterium]